MRIRLGLLLLLLALFSAASATPVQLREEGWKLDLDPSEDEEETEEEQSQYANRLVPEKPKSGKFGKGFFEQGAVKGIFTNNYLSYSPKQSITMLRPVKGEEEKKKEEQSQLPPQQQPQEPQEEKKKTIFEMDKDEFREAMVSEYGTPDQTPLVQPHADAPDCFKAASLALQKGDVALAKKYANCFVRHQKRQEQTTNEVMNLTMRAATEGKRSRFGDGSSRPDYENLTAFEDVDTDEVKARPAPEFRAGTIDSSTRQLISVVERNEPRLRTKFADEDTDEVDDPLAILFQSEKKVRAMARQKRAREVPQHESGEVRIYFFFNTDDLDSYAMFPVLERVFQSHSQDMRFHMVGFSLASLTQTQLTGMQARAKVSFPIRSGSRLARQFGVDESASTVFYSPSTGRFIVEQGIQPYGYIDEIIKMMQERAAPLKKPKTVQ